MKIKAILTDIEGTTTAISFVHDTLFPYSSEKLSQFVVDNQSDEKVGSIISEVKSEAGLSSDDVNEVVKTLHEWIAQDKKITPLKALQGLIWEAGYLSGELKGHLYDDADQYLRKWKEGGVALYVYSSGSIKAQKLLFGYSTHGDLNPLFSGYFDTTTGSKKESDSYAKITSEVGYKAEEILFLSDVEAELDAAKKTGMKTILLIRDAQELSSEFQVAEFQVAKDFVEVDNLIEN